MATPVTQICSTDGCENHAAYKTTSKPAWCLSCLSDLLAKTGLRAAEPFPGKAKAWWLTRCLTCETQAHYRFEHLLGFIDQNRDSCRACQLTSSAQLWRGKGYVQAPLPLEAIIEGLTESWFRAHRTRAGTAGAGRLRGGPVCELHAHQRQVRTGHRLCVLRRQNVRARHPTDRTTSNLLADSETPALAWWDHDANDVEVLAKTKVGGRKEVAWRCPECGHRFTARPVDMKYPSCPVCQERRDAQWALDRERYSRTPVADVPELAAAWDDDDDPSTVMVIDSWMRRFRCAEGHHPRVAPLTYLRKRLSALPFS